MKKNFLPEKYPIISVIMPVYNLNTYFKEAISSLIGQTFKDFEVICVLDGCSKEKADDIIDDFRTRLDIKVIALHRHCGAAIARNTGKANAVGDYIIFLDSDDVFDENMLFDMYTEIIKANSDICICDFQYTSKEGNEIKVSMKEIDKSKEDWIFFTHYNPWTKLCKKKYLDDNNIMFQNLTCSNDIAFSMFCYMLTDKICYLKKSYIKYRTNTGSQISSKRDSYNIFLAFSYIYDFWAERGQYLNEIILALMLSAFSEFSVCAKSPRNRVCYVEIQDFLKRKCEKITFKDKFYNDLLKKFLTEPYESEWWKEFLSFETQITYHWKDIEKQITDKKVGIWGMGKKGRIIEKLCEEHNIRINYVTDKKVLNDPRYLPSEEFIGEVDIIIASNHMVYQEALEKVAPGKLMNLQEFCKC